MASKNEDRPVISRVNDLITDALVKKSIILRFSPTENGITVTSVVDESDVTMYPDLFNRRVAQTVITRLKIMGNLSIAERRCKQSGFIEFPFDGRVIRVIKIPVKSIPGPNGEEIILDLENKPITVRASG